MLPQSPKPPTELVDDIRARLAKVCAGYAPADFDELVMSIASVRAKYDALRTEAFWAGSRELAADAPAADARLAPPGPEQSGEMSATA
jgi:hypothetical protein